MSAAKSVGAAKPIFRFPSLFRNIYSLPNVFPFRGSHAGGKATTAGIHPGYGKPEMPDKMKDKPKDGWDKPTRSTYDLSQNENGGRLMPRRKKQCGYFIGVCLLWSVGSLWLMMSVYLIVAGIIYDCPSDGNGMIKYFAIAHGSCNIGFVVMLTLTMVTGKIDDKESCFGTCSAILYVLSFGYGLYMAINVLVSFGAWRSGDFICSSALYLGELIYFCVVCLSCGMLCGIIPFLGK